MERETFDVKVGELKKTYEHCLSVISQLEKLKDHDIQLELCSIETGMRKMRESLEETVCNTKSDLSSELADIQLMYCRRLECTSHKIKRSDEDSQSRTDAKCLIAEYAIDNVIYSLLFALCEILQASVLFDGEVP